MAKSSPITQKVKSFKKQAVIKDGNLVYEGDIGSTGTPDKVTQINKDLGINYSGPITEKEKFRKQMEADQKKYAAEGHNVADLSLDDYIDWKEKRNAQQGNELFQGTETIDGVTSDVDATTWSDEDIMTDTREGGITQEEIIKGTPGTEGTPDIPVELEDKYKTVHKRDVAGNLKRTKNMQARDDERTMKGDYRDIRQMGRQSWRDLDKETKQQYKDAGMTRADWVRRGGQFQEFSAGEKGKPGSFADTDESKFAANMRVNRKHGGSIKDMMNKYGGSSDANRQTFNVASDGSLGIGDTERVSGGSRATEANIARYQSERDAQNESDLVNRDENPDSNKNQSFFKQKPHSFKTQTYRKGPAIVRPKPAEEKDTNPESPKKNIGKIINKADDIYQGGKKWLNEQGKKWSKKLDAGKQQKQLKDPSGQNPIVPSGGGGTTPSGGIMNWVKNNPIKTAIGIVGPSLIPIVAGSGSSNDGDGGGGDDITPTPPEPKKSKYGTKTWEQGYKDWGGEKKGTMEQFKSEANAWWDSDAGQKYAKKHDYKHRIKQPKVEPVNEVTPSSVTETGKGAKPSYSGLGTSTSVSDKFKADTDKMISEVNVPTSFSSGPLVTPSNEVSEKNQRLQDRVTRLEGKKQTPRRQRRIEKQKAKIAGVDRQARRSAKTKAKAVEAVNKMDREPIVSRSGEPGGPQTLTVSGKLNTSNDGNVTIDINQKTSETNRNARLQDRAVRLNEKAKNIANRGNSSYKQKGWSGYQNK